MPTDFQAVCGSICLALPPIVRFAATAAVNAKWNASLQMQGWSRRLVAMLVTRVFKFGAAHW